MELKETSLCFDELKLRQRRERDSYPESLGLRVHRALSWLERAELTEEDLDAKFIFLWVAFNAAYANDIPDQYRPTEQKQFQLFITRLFELDAK